MNSVLTVEEIAPIAAKLKGKEPRFFRPELDALRFFAFFSVFLFHAPRLPIRGYAFVAHGLAAALPLFFLLSAYLITELLLREREKTGTIHLKSFYWRRVLRIWPLYFLGVSLAIVASILMPGRYHLSLYQVFYLVVFLGWMDGYFNGNPFGQLWSISVEELFYLAWPGLMKWGGPRVLGWSSVVIAVVALYFAGSHYAWYDPRPQFLFFACGALLALWLHNRASLRINLSVRALLIVCGLLAWVWGAPVASPHPPIFLAGLLSFAAMALGCIAIFVAFYDVPIRFPEWLLKLGRISYGLYVFHVAALFSVSYLLARFGLRLPALGMALSLAITIGISALSFRFFEEPFLRWKNRYQFVQSGKA